MRACRNGGGRRGGNRPSGSRRTSRMAQPARSRSRRRADAPAGGSRELSHDERAGSLMRRYDTWLPDRSRGQAGSWHSPRLSDVGRDACDIDGDTERGHTSGPCMRWVDDMHHRCSRAHVGDRRPISGRHASRGDIVTPVQTVSAPESAQTAGPAPPLTMATVDPQDSPYGPVRRVDRGVIGDPDGSR